MKDARALNAELLRTNKAINIYIKENAYLKAKLNKIEQIINEIKPHPARK